MELTKEMSLAFIQMEIENAKDAPEVMQEMLKVIEERVKYTEMMCQKMIDKYGSKEK